MTRDDHEVEIQHATLRFIDRRMDDLAVLQWAAQLTTAQQAEQRAVREALEFRADPIPEPFAAAWRCVIAMWRRPRIDTDMKAIEIFEAIGGGVDPLWLLDDIVDLVTPVLRLDEGWGLATRRGRRRPREVSDLLRLRLDAGSLVRLANLGLGDARHIEAYRQLADRLDAELVKGLAVAQRLGPTAVWSANYVARVYAPTSEIEDGEDPEDHDPDLFRHGFAPLVRLLTEVLALLAVLDPGAGRARLERLNHLNLPLTQRIWAAAARDPGQAAADEVAAWLQALPDDAFWGQYNFPEVAELRARRFGDFAQRDRSRLEARLRRRPPSRLYRRDLDPARREAARDQAVADELGRIRVAGHELGPASRAWLDAHPDSDATSSGGIEHNLYETQFRDAPTFAPSSPAYPERGTDLLKRLNAELPLGRLYNEGRRAMDFVTVNAELVFETITAVSDPDSYPRVWAALASAVKEHRSADVVAPPEWRFGRDRENAFVDALARLTPGALADALDGLAPWMERAATAYRGDERFRWLWLSLWPAAIAATNLSRVDPDADDPGEETLAIAAMSSPAGRMTVAFRGLLPPDLAVAPEPFSDPRLAELRDAAMSVTGPARLHVLYQLLMILPYLRKADPDWTLRELLPGLLTATGSDVALWDALSRIAVPRHETMMVLAPAMADAAASTMLPEKVRSRLAERVTISVLRAALDGEPPPCPPPEMQQMLRRGGDAVRVRSATALSRFVARTGASGDDYLVAVRPLLRSSWPMDRSLLSPSLAEALAPLPARSGGDFAAAVHDLEGLLVPFNAWSIWAYGLYEKGTGAKTLIAPTTAEQAWALLALLGPTVGQAEGAVIPRDLDVALRRMSELAPAIDRDARFQRLASLARRT